MAALRRNASWAANNGLTVSQLHQSIGQRLISMTANLCFGVFVAAVLGFTILAATYHPADPYFKPSKKAISLYLSRTSNATFSQDDTVLKTGEDFAITNASLPNDPPAIASDDIKKINLNSSSSLGDADESSILESAPVCTSPNTTTIDCKDGEVFATIMRYVLENFKEVKFYRFGKPVPGDEENTCDASWRFRPKSGKRSRGVIYKDYRRFKIHRSPENPCNYSVESVGEWHSGVNARKKKHKKNLEIFEPERLRTLDNVSVVGDGVNDSLPKVKSESGFSSGKYLMYSRGGDHCKSMSQYLWSLLCALGEAQYLNRTFVMDLKICLAGVNNFGHQDQDGKDFRLYFDFEHLKEGAPVIEQGEFWSDWKKWHKKDRLSRKVVNDFRTSPMDLRDDQSTFIMRNFPKPEPDNYWYRVCEGETENVIERPWHLIWKSKRLMEIVSAISSRMKWDFDSVHVVRGDKALNREKWPNLERDTAPDSLIEKLKHRIEEGRDVYIATNEPNTHIFYPLKDVYKLHFLDDFSDLWSHESEWYNETMTLNNGSPVDFDGYMRVEVDTEVFYRGKTQIETFGELTRDCKDGVGTCAS